MSGASRYVWTHGIAPRTYDVVSPDRIDEEESFTNGSDDAAPDRSGGVIYRGTRTSFTFRKIIPNRKCECAFPEHCNTPRSDEGNGRSPGEGAAEAEMTPWQLEAAHVHRVYDEIASHFSSTRHTPWPRVKDFVVGLEDGSAILDVGCGNGKYLGLKVGVRWLFLL